MKENGSLKQKTREKKDNNAGILYVVPTPIGNLEDITLRALKVLSEVDVIYCEDTRETSRLLAKYGVETPLKTYLGGYREKTKKIIDELLEGKNIALVSDRGTPAVNDPGFEVISQAYENRIRVVPLPGANAAITALSASGFNTDIFLYAGFLPAKGSQRKKIIQRIAGEQTAVVFYESPSRILKTLKEIAAEGSSNRLCICAREITKVYEEFVRGPLETVIQHFEKNKPRGEFVVVLAPHKTEKENKIDSIIEELLAGGLTPRQIAHSIHLLRGIGKSVIYKKALEIAKRKK